MNEADLQSDGALKIGAVARLTGLSSHTLRKWESRYGAVVPERTERGQRLYARGDVERLSLIKRLVDAGVAPRDVARLGHAELAQRVEHLTQAQRDAEANSVGPLSTVIVGRSVAALCSANRSTLHIVASAPTSDALELPEGHDAVDLLVYECDTVQHDTHRTLDQLMKRCAAHAAVLVYRFSNRGDLLSIQAPSIATMRAPAEPDTLVQVAAGLMRAARRPRASATARDVPARNDVPVDVPAPRLSHAVITKIAQTAPRIRCECPQHLADILLGLRAFEDYSEACENRSPEDAALHHYLWRSAAQARALFEDAIEHVAAAEGIRLEE